jgi:hypothetical protein
VVIDNIFVLAFKDGFDFVGDILKCFLDAKVLKLNQALLPNLNYKRLLGHHIILKNDVFTPRDNLELLSIQESNHSAILALQVKPMLHQS